MYAANLVPLLNFTPLPRSLSAVPQPNGDIFLQYSNGEEAEFDLSATRGSGLLGNPSTLASFHEQAVFDTTCQWIVLPPLAQHAGANMNSCDPQPVYNMNLLL